MCCQSVAAVFTLHSGYGQCTSANQQTRWTLTRRLQRLELDLVTIWELSCRPRCRHISRSVSHDQHVTMERCRNLTQRTGELFYGALLQPEHLVNKLSICSLFSRTYIRKAPYMTLGIVSVLPRGHSACIRSGADHHDFINRCLPLLTVAIMTVPMRRRLVGLYHGFVVRSNFPTAPASSSHPPCPCP